MMYNKETKNYNYYDILEKGYLSFRKISFSKLKTAECPLKYTLKYIYGFNTQIENIHLEIGKEIHKLFELTLSDLKNNTDKNSIEIMNILENGTYKQKFETQDVISALFNIKKKANILLEKYNFEMEIEKSFNYKLKEFELLGIFDLLFFNPKTKQVIIVDHKTGKKIYPNTYFVQGAIYKYIAHNVFNSNNVKFYLNYIVKNNNGEHLIKVNMEKDKKYEEYLYSIITEKLNKYIKNPFKKEENFLCKYCEYYEFCQKYKNIEYSNVLEYIISYIDEKLEELEFAI